MHPDVPARHILHIDLDSFFVSVERLKNPGLVCKPVIVGGKSDRGVVSSCSYEARAFGVHSAMSIVKARQLCPDGVFVSGDYGDYGYFSKLVTNIIRQEAPVYEKASIDEFYLDLTGFDAYVGCFEWAQRLRKRVIKETGLPISFGLGSNKLVAKMATNQGKPNGEFSVPNGQEAAFLRPLDVGKIPMVGDKLVADLNRIGIYKVADLQDYPLSALTSAVGTNAEGLKKRALGIDHRAVGVVWQQKSMSQERTFPQDVDDKYFLEMMIARMAENLAYELREQNKLSTCVTIKIRYADFRTVSHQISIDATDLDQVFMQTGTALFHKLYLDGFKVRLLGLRLSNLVEHGYQTAIFDTRPKIAPLNKAMDSLKDKYGLDVVRRLVSKNK